MAQVEVTPKRDDFAFSRSQRLEPCAHEFLGLGCLGVIGWRWITGRRRGRFVHRLFAADVAALGALGTEPLQDFGFSNSKQPRQERPLPAILETIQAAQGRQDAIVDGVFAVEQRVAVARSEQAPNALAQPVAVPRIELGRRDRVAALRAPHENFGRQGSRRPDRTSCGRRRCVGRGRFGGTGIGFVIRWGQHRVHAARKPPIRILLGSIACGGQNLPGMDMVIVIVAACAAAGLTLISGFGLGTLLVPVFALIYGSVPLAIAATALVHLANNIFKAGMLWRDANWRAVVAFGLPGSMAAIGGAKTLEHLAGGAPLLEQTFGVLRMLITKEGLVVGLMIIAFAVVELSPRLRRIQFSQRWLPVGGILSGYVGGLSGHQGALRSAFLLRLNLSKEQYVATGTMCAILIDVARLSVYGSSEIMDNVRDLGPHGFRLVLAGTLAAFLGSWLGRRYLRKITMSTVHWIVGVLLVLIGLLLALGIQVHS